MPRGVPRRSIDNALGVIIKCEIVVKEDDELSK